MYAAAPAARARGIWPFAAICCLGLLGFLIAATIVLALIPIYLPTKEISSVNNNANGNDTFYLQYSADPTVNQSVSGSLENLDELEQTTGLGDGADIFEGFTRATFVRRRRGLTNRRQKRTPRMGIILGCNYKFDEKCKKNRQCREKRKNEVDKRIQQLATIPNFQCRVRSGGQVIIFTLRVILVGIVRTNFGQLKFGYGVVASLTIVAIRSGPFDDPTTWDGGVVPFSGCSIIIPVGITVSFTRSVLEFPLLKIDIFGTIALGAGSSSFTFNYPPNIIVHSGGIIQDLTSSKLILIPSSSFIVIYPGGAFSAAGTVIQTYSSSGLGSSVTVTIAAGPFTCGVLPDGTLLSFNKVIFIVTQSGGFTDGSTFLGGFGPSAEACSDGCGINIPSGFTLDTSDLDGTLTLNIDEIFVSVGATLVLGKAGSNKGFKFLFPCQLDIHGTLSFVGIAGAGIYIPGGSNINFFTGAIFTSTIVTFIQTIDVITLVNIGAPFPLPTFISGPYFITISITGEISISTIGPGGSTITSTISTTALSIVTSTTTAISTPALI